MSQTKIRFGKYIGIVYSRERMELTKEIQNHPRLLENIAADNATDWADVLASTAAYCDILLDGLYNEADQDRLAAILYDKLRAKRYAIILPRAV